MFWRIAGASLGVATISALAMACGGDKTAAPAVTPTVTATASTSINVMVGVNDPQDPNIAVLAYMPQAITVEVGTEVQWTMAGPEPHSVTFLPAGQALPALSDSAINAFFAPTPPTGPYDGTTLVNSGLVPTGPEPGSLKLSFAKAGAFNYVCVIHPQMMGAVTVVEKGQKADAPADATSCGASVMSY